MSAAPLADNSAIIRWVNSDWTRLEEAVMGTTDERAEERREVEAERVEVRERRADVTPAPRVPRTPREEVEAYILSAADCLHPINAATGGTAARDVAGALRWLDRAREVLRSPDVVDGAALLERKLVRALELEEEGEYAGDALRQVIELLRARTRADEGDAIPVHEGDYDRTEGRALKRSAVRSVLVRWQFTYVAELLGDDAAIDEIIVAAETGV